MTVQAAHQPFMLRTADWVHHLMDDVPLQKGLRIFRILAVVTAVLFCSTIALGILASGISGMSVTTAAVLCGFTGILGLVSFMGCKIADIGTNRARIREQALPLLKTQKTPVQTEGESLFENEKMQDVLSTVFREYLPPQDVNSSRLVSKTWHRLVKREALIANKVASYLALHRYYETVDRTDRVALFYIVQTFLKWGDCRTALKVADQIPDTDWKMDAGLQIAKVRYRQGEEAQARAYVHQCWTYHRRAFAHLDLQLKNYTDVLYVLEDDQLWKQVPCLRFSLIEEAVEADFPSEEKKRLKALYLRIKKAIGHVNSNERAQLAYIAWHLGCFDHEFLVRDGHRVSYQGYTYLAHRLSAYVDKNSQNSAAFHTFKRFITEQVGTWPADGIDFEVRYCKWVYLHRCVALGKREEAERIRSYYPDFYTTLLMAPLVPLQPAFWEESKVVYQEQLAAAQIPENVTWAREVLTKNQREHACSAPSLQMYDFYPSLLLPLDMSVIMRNYLMFNRHVMKDSFAFGFCMHRLNLLCRRQGVTSEEIEEATQEALLVATTLGPLRIGALLKLADHEASRGYRERAKEIVDEAAAIFVEAAGNGSLNWHFSQQKLLIIQRYRAFGYDQEACRLVSGVNGTQAYIASFGPPEKPFYDII